MNKTAEYALLAAGSYDDIRPEEIERTREKSNRSPIPAGWAEISVPGFSAEKMSQSAGRGASGFSASPNLLSLARNPALQASNHNLR